MLPSRPVLGLAPVAVAQVVERLHPACSMQSLFEPLLFLPAHLPWRDLAPVSLLADFLLLRQRGHGFGAESSLR